MLKECYLQLMHTTNYSVLILILMEHAQRVEVWRIGIQNGAAQS